MILKVENLVKEYGKGMALTKALDNVSFSVEEGEFVAIVGASGSGKSTFIKMLYREEKPTNGKVIVGGINVARLRNAKVYKLRRKLGIVFQDFKLLQKLTVY